MTHLVPAARTETTGQPTLRIDPLLQGAVADALRSTGRYTAEYEVLRHVVSGSRMNYLLAVHLAGDDAAERAWCRGTYPSIDQALSERFTLAQEHRVIAALTEHLDRIPVVLGRSGDGCVMIQRYVEEDASADRAQAIPAYMRALDAVHRLDARVLSPDGSGPRVSAHDAAEAEQAAWLAVATELVGRSADLSVAERASGLVNLPDRLRRIIGHLESTAVPSLEGCAGLVHGDAGRANYLVDVHGEVWLIDWELAHAGHRYEDYAWIELRGLEQDNEVWCQQVLARLERAGATATADYAYFRSAIYFRSVIAIAARITSEPSHDFVPYLTRRLDENELFGWLSTGAGAAAERDTRRPRIDATRYASWQVWSRALEAKAA